VDASKGLVRCPMCRSKHVAEVANKVWYCSECSAQFDPVDDGVTPYGNPSRIVERRDGFQHREKARKLRR
jgi:ribosomal protein L37AE/L43A